MNKQDLIDKLKVLHSNMQISDFSGELVGSPNRLLEESAEILLQQAISLLELSK